ncbi:uncharacterized protein LOC121060085 isoform X4 [Cygnus olor]|uniref:uncharacterized protein LOC121060085 isoform X4 n=1 Tax=Cygnus olor TaxID=8869 RepID=UPI001ADE7B83|nr:uncharacterized protein LOC121060085 isoform X4 [Cygnus olor]
MWGLGVLVPLLGVGALWVIQDPSEVQPPSATLSILRARPGDAGCYVCRVTLEIPRYATATGNGTVLRVSAGRGIAQSGAATVQEGRGQDGDGDRDRDSAQWGWHSPDSAFPPPAAADAGHGAGLVWGLAGALGGAFLLLGLAVLGYRHWHRRTDTAIYLNVLPRSARTPKK